MSNFEFAYFQKSTAFLYPILGLPKMQSMEPIGTYLEIENFTFESTTPLICLYHTSNPKFQETLKILKAHNRYEFDFYLNDETHIVIFDMSHIQKDYDNFIAGKYSKLSSNFRTIVTGTFPKNKIILMAFDPVLNYAEVARDLNVSVEDLIGHEICETPKMNTDGEVLFIKDKTALELFYNQ